jgi:3-dehydroquinate dehydratase/shikimate dehydrogenase
VKLVKETCLTMRKSPVKTLLICPLTSPDIPAMRCSAEEAFAQGADAVECRLDHLAVMPSEHELAGLLAGLAGRAIVTCRPTREGGNYTGDEDTRLAILRQAAGLGSLAVDVELDVPENILATWPGNHDGRNGPMGGLILSHHDFHAVPNDLKDLAGRIDASPADVVKIAFTAAGPEDGLLALDVVQACSKPAIVLAMGQAGLVSRVLAGKVGAFGTFASLDEQSASAPGQPSLAEMKNLYHWDRMDSRTEVFGVVGCPVGHSMSPAIHNAAFAQMAMNAVYLPLLVLPGWENFDRFMRAVLDRPALDWRGLSVTIPHKENALRFIGADNCDELAVSIGSVNTITINPDGQLRGDNTDYAAAIDALCTAMGIARDGLANRSVAVLGSGGAARSIVAGLRHYDAEVTIYNRTIKRAQILAEEFTCQACGLDQADRTGAEIIINCTPIGMHPRIDASPIAKMPPSAKVVFDTIYNPLETLLLRQARLAGCLVVPGLEMFVNQAIAQFEIWTGRPAPAEIMRQVVLGKLAGQK